MVQLPGLLLPVELLRERILDNQHLVQLLHVGRAEDDQDKGSVGHEEQGGDGEDQIRKVKDSDRQVFKCTISPGKEPKIVGSVCRVQMIKATVLLNKPGGDLMT